MVTDNIPFIYAVAN